MVWGGELGNMQTTCQGGSSISWPYAGQGAHQEAQGAEVVFYAELSGPLQTSSRGHLRACTHTHTHGHTRAHTRAHTYAQEYMMKTQKLKSESDNTCVFLKKALDKSCPWLEPPPEVLSKALLALLHLLRPLRPFLWGRRVRGMTEPQPWTADFTHHECRDS